MPKIRRNDPCWCGSGRKFKHCHLNRDQMAPVTMHESLKNIRKSFSKKYCLHPEASKDACQGGIIKAHTIQRNGGLSRIAHNGKVYSSLWNASALNNNFAPKLEGIGKASVFTGFCKYHDQKTFIPIENNPFQINPHHTFLLGYRGLCREVFAKQGHKESLRLVSNMDRGLSVDQQFDYQQFFKAYEDSVTKGLRDLSYHKRRFDSALLSSDFSEVNYYVIVIKEVPEIMCSGSIAPECDFHGNLLQNLCDPNIILDQISFSIIPAEAGGLIVFTWMGSQPSCEKLIKSVDNMNNQQLPDAIARFTFEFLENTFFSPSWWDNANTYKKDKVISRIKELSMEKMRDPSCLYPDGISYVNWEIKSRHYNLAPSQLN